jgi:predicted metal-dependent hydrolase
MESVQYGTQTIEFNLKRVDRKTLGIEVHPDQSVWAISPLKSDLEDIKNKIIKRGNWIVKQRIYFDQFLPRNPAREYVSGETHYYLGKRYLLKVRPGERNEVKLKNGQFIIFSKSTSSHDVKRIFSAWYYNHAKNKFDSILKESFNRFKSNNIDFPELEIRRMKNRWGSCTPEGKVILNPELIKASRASIEYVVIHELCHLIESNHGKNFYDLLSDKLPGWKLIKHKLETLNI